MEQLMRSGFQQFILAGKAFFTLVSLKTQMRYTYRVVKHKTKDIWFVSFLRGPDNTKDYGYLGIVKNRRFTLTGKSSLSGTSGPVVAIKWFMDVLADGGSTDHVEFYHAGRCGRCGRMLTVPDSITMGYGPECIHLMGGFSGSTTRSSLPQHKTAAGPNEPSQCGYCGEEKPGCRCERKAAYQMEENRQEQLAFEYKYRRDGL